MQYTEVEADTREEAEEIARDNGGTWLRLPLLIERKVVRTHGEDEPHESPAEIAK